MKPFVVLSLPRSRSFWLSCFLSDSARPVEHEPSRNFRAREDVGAYFARPGAAAVDTALGLIWRDLELPPNIKLAVMHRPLDEVCASLDRLGLPSSGMPELADKLNSLPGLHFDANRLGDEATASAVYAYCTGYTVSRCHWEEFAKQNLQANPAAMMVDALANIAGIQAVFGKREAA